MWRKLARFLFFLLLLASISGSIGYLTFWYYFEYKIDDLPDVMTLKNHKLNLATVVYGDDCATVIDKFALEDRIFLRFDDIPDNVIKAITAAEDKCFWCKRLVPGVDIKGIARAAWDDLRAKKVVAGGSTITQQVAKKLWLSDEKTAGRKFKEMRIAHQMEKRLPKELIFETYVNLVYMGHNRYGIFAGTVFYFGKLPPQLSLDEAAMLAGLIKWPYKFSPLNNPKIARDRRNTILERMERAGFISEDQLMNLKIKKLVLASDRQNTLAPYFSSFFMEELHWLGYESIVTAGLKVCATINPEMQRIANSALVNGLNAYDKRHQNRLVLYNVISDYKIRPEDFRADNWRGKIGVGSVVDGLVVEANPERALAKIANDKAIITVSSFAKIRQDVDDLQKVFKEGDVVILKITGIDREKNFTVEILQPRVEGAVVVVDVKTGAVKAMVGGRDFSVSKYNRAMQAERQPGSSFKPFVYGAYFESYPDRDLNNRVKDSPVCFKTGNPKKPLWCPKNYEEKSRPRFMGSIPIRDAIALSRNVAAINTVCDIGRNEKEKIKRKLKDLEDFGEWSDEELRELKLKACSLGINRVVDVANALGVDTELPRYLPTAIGAADVKVIDMATAFSAFFRQGEAKPYWFIEKVADKDGNEKNYIPQESKQAISRDTADKILEAMRWVALVGTARSASKELPFAVAGKTGTTNNFTDAWFVGGTPRYVIAAWVGFDRKAVPLVSREAPQFKETGSFAVLPIFIDLMKGIYKDKAYDEFPEEIEARIKGEPISKKEEIKDPD